MIFFRGRLQQLKALLMVDHAGKGIGFLQDLILGKTSRARKLGKPGGQFDALLLEG